ncbi:MAG: bifunctional demethylmenaquinone methyltransferase/2-methoxy-6-polyprenyl-1,4-benzoquinol methylase UbiE [Dehalococcoidia bacterium]|jgi:demethylmenaquinone methyltransferase/2-methoxy-6-polyprenyl-1,4-benzoquinol methylase
MAENHPAGKPKPLHRIFTTIPERYDLINHVITLGMDTGWRKQAALACLSSRPQRILDICCGTGDLTIVIARLAEYNPEIIGVDYSQPMLDKAAEKAAKLARGKDIKFVNSEIAQLPFQDSWFDCVGISFAFRNLTYKNPLAQEHLDEVLRVLKPGGKYVIVESSQPGSAFIRMLDHLYMRLWVFPSGLLISGNKAAYKYLVESAEQFFSAEEAQEFLIKAGFKQVTFKRLFFGAAAVYVATK